jgi:uncharacterized protein YgiM (DUF1202 family)
MSERKSMDDWQLTESPESGDQWQLLDQEQGLPDDLQLQNDAEAPHNQWQPVAYEEETKSSGTSWILPTLIIVALLAVLGYVGWLAMNGFDFGALTSQPSATAEPANQQQGGEPGVVAVATSPPQEETSPPTATSLPPTATPEPAPTQEPTPAMVEQEMATVDSEYGLNARTEPNSDLEPVQILDNGLTAKVVNKQDGWVQLELDNGDQVWVSADFVTLSTAMVPAPAGATAPPAAEAPAAGESSAPAGVAGGKVAIVVSAEAGVNARDKSSTEGKIVKLLLKDEEFPATGVSDDDKWIRIELDGAEAWVAADFVTVNGDLASLKASVVSGGGAEAAPAATTAPASEPTATPEPTPTPVVSLEDAMVSVDTLVGVGSRVAPSSDADRGERLPGGTEVPALGRSADSEWIQVELESGDKVWVFAGAVTLNIDIDALPVIEP